MGEPNGVVEYRLSSLEGALAKTNEKIDSNHDMTQKKFDTLTDSVAVLLDRSASADAERLARIKRERDSGEVPARIKRERDSGEVPATEPASLVSAGWVKNGGIVGALWVVFHGLDKLAGTLLDLLKLGGK